MNLDSRYATRLESIDEVPEPFSKVLHDQCRPDEPLYFLAYAPALREGLRGAVMAIAADRWFIIAEEEGAELQVNTASFEDTLLVEWIHILLFGQIKIDFTVYGERNSASVQFNTVTETMFREALELLLAGIGSAPRKMRTGVTRPGFSIPADWPMKFYNDIRKYAGQEEALIAATQWPAISAGFGRELTPATAMALTERDLVIIAEEKASGWFQPRDDPRYGRTVTYFPLARLGKHEMSLQDRVGFLVLKAHAEHGDEKLEILFPPEKEPELSEFMSRVDEGISHLHASIHESGKTSH